ncbi:MAG: hypothetical protein LRY71_01060 [Bacillaceae bacterium]|nr:hypothetical protein [Bacillaceae bacterium]
MIIDEAHHATAHSYKVLFDKARQIVGESLFPVCGLTATPGRSNNETMQLVDEFEAYLIHPTLPEMENYELNPLLYFREKGYLAEPIFLLHENGEELEVADDMIDEETQDLTSEFLKSISSRPE